MQLFAFTVFAVAAVLSGAGACARTAHTPEAECDGITVSAIPAGTADGRQQAGFLKSAVGRLDLYTTVQGGIAGNYTLSLAGRSLLMAPKPWPHPVVVCLRLKRIQAAGQQLQDCRGTRFEVVMARAGAAQYFLLAAMTKPGPWRLCRAFTVAGSAAAPR